MKYYSYFADSGRTIDMDLKEQILKEMFSNLTLPELLDFQKINSTKENAAHAYFAFR